MRDFILGSQSFGVKSSRRRGGGAAADNAAYGALTLAGVAVAPLPTGAASITDAGGTNLVVSGSDLAAGAGGGISAGTVTFDNGATITVAPRADTYWVGTVAELQAVLDLGVTISGKGVEMRPGVYDTFATRGVWWHDKFNAFTAQVTIRPTDTADRPKLNWFDFYGTGSNRPGDITLQDLDFFDDYSSFSYYSATNNFIAIQVAGSGRTGRAKNVSVRGCTFDWSLPKYTVAAFPDGIRIENITGAFAVSEVVTGAGGATGTVSLIDGNVLRLTGITGTFNNGEAVTGSIAGAANITSTGAYVTGYPVGAVEYSGIGTTIGCDNLLIEDCEFMNLVNGISFFAGDGITIQRNNFHDMWADAMSYGCGQDGVGGLTPTRNVLVEDNEMSRPIGNFTWRHADFAISYGGAVYNQTVDVTDAVFRRNVIFLSDQTLARDENGVAAAVQFMLMKKLGLNMQGLVFDAPTGAFTVGLTVTGATSGATGVIRQVTADTLYIDGISGTFQDNEAITDTATGAATANIPGGLVAGTGNSGIYRGFTVEGNVFLSDVAHFVTSEVEIADSIVRANTAPRSREQYVEYGAAGNVPAINLMATDCDIYQNFCGSVNEDYNGWTGTGNMIEDNVVQALDPATLSEYTALFAGATFLPTSKAATLADLRIGGASSLLDADSSGTASQGDIGALGYSTSDGYADFDGRALNTGILGVYTVPATMGAPDWGAATSASSGSVDLTITTAPATGGTAILDYEYTTDAGTSWRSMGLSAPGTVAVNTQSGGTAMAGSTSYDFAVRAVNVRGGGAASDTKAATTSAVVSISYTYVGLRQEGPGSAGTRTFPAITMNAENHVLLVGARTSNTIDALRVNGVTAVKRLDVLQGTDARLVAFEIAPATTGSKTIEIDVTGGEYSAYQVAVCEITNAAFVASLNASQGGEAPTVVEMDINTAAGDIVIGATSHGANDTMTVGAGFDQMDALSYYSNNLVSLASAASAAGGTPEVFAINGSANFRTIAAMALVYR